MNRLLAWRARLPGGLRPYLEREPVAALLLGISSGFPYAMIGATLTTRLARDGIDKRSITAFSLAFLVYNLKFLWAWAVDGVRIPVLGRLGQRVSWMIASGLFVIAAVVNLALADPQASILWTAYAAVADGARVRIAAKGHAGVRGGLPGDLLLDISVAEHPRFKREGDDLHMSVPIAIHEAALGAKIEIDTPDGHVRLRVHAERVGR